MTNVVKKQTCIEWTVQTSTTYGSKLKSEYFVFQGCKCHFEFYTGYPSYGHNNFYFYSDKKLIKPVDVLVVVECYSKTTLLEKKSFEGSYEIWENLPYEMRGCKLTFKVIIEGERLEEDKCLQTATYLNTEVSVESFTKDFTKLLNSGPNHDAEIKCGEISIKAHKNVLCARSDVFKTMLESDMQEGRTGIMQIQDMDVKFLKDFVRYLYTGAMPELTFDEAIVLYEAGDKYAVKSLMFRCLEYLQDNLSPEKAFQCFALADAHSDQELKVSVINYILKEKVYLQDEYWSPFCESYPKVAIEVYKMSHKNGTEVIKKKNIAQLN